MSLVFSFSFVSKSYFLGLVYLEVISIIFVLGSFTVSVSYLSEFASLIRSWVFNFKINLLYIKSMAAETDEQTVLALSSISDDSEPESSLIDSPSESSTINVSSA